MQGEQDSILLELVNAKVGSSVTVDHQECIVFHKYKEQSSEGKNGLAFIKTMPEEFSKEYEWGAVGEIVTGLNPDACGIENTEKALSFKDSSGERPAFFDSNGGNNTIWSALDSWNKSNGNSGKWFIPSCKELEEIYKCLFEEEKGDIEGYWSSTECVIDNQLVRANFVAFYYGNIKDFSKSLRAKVLFCRVF